jgi:hypothetical protein
VTGVAFLLDALVAALLAATIGFAFVLNRRLGVWRREKSAFEKLIGEFNTAAARAETGIAALKKLGEETGSSLSQGLAKGQALRDDLAYLVERGAQVADRLATQTRPRALVADDTVSAAKGGTNHAVSPGPRSAAERDLAKALSGLR